MHWLQRLRHKSKFVQTCVLNTYVYIYIYLFIFIFKCDSNIDDYIYIYIYIYIYQMSYVLAALVGRCCMLR